MQFQLGWMADPLVFGDYPEVLRRSQKNLPRFKDPEKKLLAGSVDFFAINYYTSHFVGKAPMGAPADQVRMLILMAPTVEKPQNFALLRNEVLCINLKRINADSKEWTYGGRRISNQVIL